MGLLGEELSGRNPTNIPSQACQRKIVGENPAKSIESAIFLILEMEGLRRTLDFRPLLSPDLLICTASRG